MRQYATQETVPRKLKSLSVLSSDHLLYLSLTLLASQFYPIIVPPSPSSTFLRLSPYSLPPPTHTHTK